MFLIEFFILIFSVFSTHDDGKWLWYNAKWQNNSFLCQSRWTTVVRTLQWTYVDILSRTISRK